MNRWRIILIAVFILSTAGAYACEFSYTLIGADGSSQSLRPGTDIHLTQGETYTLKVVFTEDHGNCKIKPEDTDFLLDEEKWKTSKDYLKLKLVESIIWQDLDSRRHIAEISFCATVTGICELEIIRDCDKGGYNEVLRFIINRGCPVTNSNKFQRCI